MFRTGLLAFGGQGERRVGLSYGCEGRGVLERVGKTVISAWCSQRVRRLHVLDGVLKLCPIPGVTIENTKTMVIVRLLIRAVSFRKINPSGDLCVSAIFGIRIFIDRSFIV